jgi:hypothetical protein
MQEGRLFATLRTLVEGEVQFILVGGLAAVLHGASLTTFDVDVVYSTGAANVERILRCLESLDAGFRLQPDRRLKPDRSHITRRGHLNPITRLGALDLPGTIGEGLGYEELLPRSTEMDIGGDVVIRVPDLETIIATKEQVGDEKDLASLPILRRTLIELRRREEN